ncbi:MAG: hypothetical protein QHH06_05835 [Clostridiales bacterium]|jgi:hypothetical protein|nr:hypothetical protein [Eubacteriales bacterium]MDH7565986.1 hypothetical protein [Clostridiales bacterium]
MQTHVLSSLADYTLDFLTLLFKQYKKGNIDIHCFSSHAAVKINFLKDVLDYFEDAKRKEEAAEVILKCEQVFSSHPFQ